MSLFLLTLVLGTTCIALCRVLTELWVTPASLYWMAWLFGLSSSELLIRTGTYPPLDLFATNLITQAHFGAFLGFVLASLLARISLPMLPRVPPGAALLLPIPRFIWLIAAVGFIGGSIALAQVVGSAGTSTLTGFFTSARSEYISATYRVDRADLPWFFLLMNYAGSFTALLPVLLAARDVSRGTFSRNALLLAFAATVPGGLATGGRGWLLAAVLPYLLVFAFYADLYKRLHLLRRVFVFASIFFMLFVLLVSAIGFLRSGQNYSDVAANSRAPLELISPFYTYGAQPIMAVYAYSRFAAMEDRTWGLASFAFISRNLRGLGLPVPQSIETFFGRSRDYVFSVVDYRLGSTHATFIPDVVRDLGTGLVWLGVLVLCTVFQYMSLWGASRGHILAGVVFLWAGVNGAFSVAQANMFGQSGAFLALLAGCVVAWQYDHHLVKRKLRLEPVQGVFSNEVFVTSLTGDCRADDQTATGDELPYPATGGTER